MEPDPKRETLIRLVVDGTISDAIVALSKFNINVVVPTEAQNKPFKGRYITKPMEEALNMIASYVGPEAQVFQRQGFVYIGPPTDRDKISAIFYVPSGTGQEWIDFYKRAGTTAAEASAQRDRILIRDSKRGLERIKTLQQFISARRRQYIASIVFVELTDSQSRRFGAKLELLGTSELEIGTSRNAFDLAASIRAALFGDASKTEDFNYSATDSLITEGEQSEIHIGDTVVVPKRSISDQGTVTDVGYDEFKTGIDLKLRCSTVGQGTVRLDVEPDISNLLGFVSGLPQISHRSFSTAVFLRPGGTVIIGGLSRLDGSQSDDLLPISGKSTSRTVRDGRTKLFLILQLKEI